jgi:hypothetical protein
MAMDKPKLCDMLGAHPYGTFWVRDVHLFDWGSEIVLDCLYEPGTPGKPVPFQLILKDCRDLNWRVYAHLKHPEDASLPTATLINIRLGTDNHRKPLTMLTDFFGLNVSYGSLTVQKTD